jgi:CTP:molybdopterin cytidylyltransferase MocA
VKVSDGKERRDLVVVLARGRGLRMGQPKAGLQLPGDDRTFLARILDLYDAVGLPVLVVTYPGGQPSCEAAAQGRVMKLVEGPEAGDTALTLLTARRQTSPNPGPVTHWWAHPVDVPLVTGVTLENLQAISRGEPGRIVRPVHRGQVGHPVVLPFGVLDALQENEDWHTAPLRHFLEHIILSGHEAPVHTVSVSDQGVVQDFDQPGDLMAWKPGSSPR